MATDDPLQLLLVEDSPDDAALILRELKRSGLPIEARVVDALGSARAALEERSWDLIITDYSLPGFDGLAVLELVRARQLDCPFILVSGTIGEEAAVAAMRAGAHDYVMKDRLGRLSAAIQRELREAEIRQERRLAAVELQRSQERFESVFRHNPAPIAYGAVDTGLLQDVNERFAAFFGYPREEMIGQTVFDLQIWANLAERTALLEDLARTGSIESRLVHFRRRTGEIRDTLLGMHVLHLTGEQVVIAMLTDITERKRAEEQLRVSREQLRALALHLQSIREEERRQMAREIHDQMGQALTGLKLDLTALRRLAGTTGAPDEGTIADRCTKMSRALDELVQQVRRLSSELRPSVLDDLGLAAAIEWQAEEFQQRAGIACTVASAVETPQLHPKAATAVFRIFQELLTNVARHAQATAVEVKLQTQRGKVVLVVADNGRGVSEAELLDSKSLGVLGMRERAAVFGGQLRFAGVPGRGTTVTVEVPATEA